MKDHVRELEKLKDDTELEKLRYFRDAQIAKQTYITSTTRAEVPAKEKKCGECEVHKKQEAQRKSLLQQVLCYLKHLSIYSKLNSMYVKARANGGGDEMCEIERFELNDLRKRVKCSVCQDAPKNVIISKCFHMFCKDCIENNLKARNRKCPTCKKMFGQDDVKNMWWA